MYVAMVLGGLPLNCAVCPQWRAVVHQQAVGAEYGPQKMPSLRQTTGDIMTKPNHQINFPNLRAEYLRFCISLIIIPFNIP